MEHQDIEFEMGDWTVTVDINGIEGNSVDFTVTDMQFDMDTPVINASDCEYPSEDDIRDEVETYAEEEGLL